MYSGLLPKGLSEAELSSEDSESDIFSGDCDASTTIVGESKHDSDALPSSETLATQSETLQIVDSPGHSPSDECLPGVSQEMWEKFKQLQKQKDDQSREFPSTKRKRKRRANKRKCSDPDTQNKESKKVDDVNTPSKHLEGLKQYFGINERFESPPCSKRPLQSGLEKTIDGAIAAGDYETAEQLSDKLATRDLAVKIKNAVDCRDFVQAKQEMEASKAAQKRKKNLVWGFEAKKRWETKSNMGYM